MLTKWVWLLLNTILNIQPVVAEPRQMGSKYCKDWVAFVLSAEGQMTITTLSTKKTHRLFTGDCVLPGEVVRILNGRAVLSLKNKSLIKVFPYQLSSSAKTMTEISFVKKVQESWLVRLFKRLYRIAFQTPQRFDSNSPYVNASIGASYKLDRKEGIRKSIIYAFFH